MSDEAKRTQWAEHLRDEAGAIAQQQVSAGSTHEPLEGPLPHTRNDTAAAVQDAVVAERQHCAAIAAAFAADAQLLQVLPDATASQLQAAAVLARHIADILRTGTPPGG